ncbi:MAG: thioredoxin domain-containing protein [Burkholderiales bacterium]
MLPRLFFLVSCLLLAPSISAAEPIRPFVSGSLTNILAERQGKPFVLAFWSVTCAYCPAELKALGKIRKSHPKLDIVLVAADTPEDAPLAAEMVAGFGLGKVEQWIFADDMPERLRFEIDPRWHGELPRTHFYGRDHRVEVVSGVVPQPRLTAWMKANVP